MELSISNPFSRHECQRLDLDSWETIIAETYGQRAEDLIVEALLRVRLFRAGRSGSDLKYIEIGANHPVVHSSSYLFHKKYGAHGILVEPIPALCEILSRSRPGDSVVNCAVSASHDETATLYVARHSALSSLDKDHIKQFSGEGKSIADVLTVPNLHINSFMEIYAPKIIDFLSVDTEGMDLKILQTLDTDRFRPAVIQCEPGSEFTQIIDMFKAKQYVLLATTDVNMLFADAFSLLGMA